MRWKKKWRSLTIGGKKIKNLFTLDWRSSLKGKLGNGERVAENMEKKRGKAKKKRKEGNKKERGILSGISYPSSVC